VYYLLPDPLWPGGLTRDSALLLLLALVFILELARLLAGAEVPGMRPYEGDRISAAAWAALGMTIALLFFPPEYVTPVILGMGLVDPLIGELRARDSALYPALPAAVYFFMALLAMILMIGPGANVLIASAAATGLALAAEKPKLRLVDDDFLMLIVPLVGVHLILELLPIG